MLFLDAKAFGNSYGRVQKLRHLVLWAIVVSNFTAVANGFAIERLVEKSVADADFTGHDEQNFVHFFKLILN